jgi:hypothetical protein
MRMSQHNFLMNERFWQIINVKFKRWCRFYFEFYRFRIKDDHQCCVKYEDFLHFLADSNRVRKIFRRFSNSLFLNDVNYIYSRIDIFRCQHVQWSIFNFEKFIRWLRSIWTKKIFFRKEILFSLFNDWSFRERLIISLFKISFRERNLDISIAIKLLIDVDLNDDVSSNVNN